MIELTARRVRAPSVRGALRKGISARLPVFVTAGLVIGGLSFANGGYFPVSWGWSALGLLWLAAIALALGLAIEAGGLDFVFLGALTGFTAWTFLSALWSSTVPETVLEGERILLYLSAAFAGFLLLRRASVSALLVGVVAAITAVSTYALVTRMFPDRIGVFDPIAGYRFSDPVGYWNAFGILAAMGALIALGLAARSGPAARCFAAGSGVLLLLTVYFTYSRGGWIAFFVGLAAAIAVDRRRLQLITTTLVLAPWPALAIWIASTSPALTHESAGLAAASRDGHGLAVITIGLVVAAALAVLALDWAETAISIPHGLRRAYAGTLIFLVTAFLIVVFGRYGFPPTLARKTYDAFNAPAPAVATDLNSRLFSLSGNGRTEQFHTAWQQVTDHPVLGGGSGSYGEYWFQHRRVPATVHDAHNLYLETLAELGPIGLAHARPRSPARRRPTSPGLPARGRRRRCIRRVPRARVRRLGLGDAGSHAHGARVRACAPHPRSRPKPGASASAKGAHDCSRGNRCPRRVRPARAARQQRNLRQLEVRRHGAPGAGGVTGPSGDELRTLVSGAVAEAGGGAGSRR